MEKLKTRKTQTQVKHEILSKYLDVWGGIIVQGLKHAKRQNLWKFIYIDCFSNSGKYLCDHELIYQNSLVNDPVYGSSIIGIRALDKLKNHATQFGINISTNVILVEKDPRIFSNLKNNLSECGYLDRVIETTDFNILQNNQIAIVNDDSTKISNKIIEFSNKPGTWAFYLLDPYGPSGIPYDFVKSIIACENHDVMINFIYEDFLRKTGMAINNDLKPSHQKLVQLWRNVFGDDIWEQVIMEKIKDFREGKYWKINFSGIPFDDIDNQEVLTDDKLNEIKERSFVYVYRDVLKKMDPNISIKLSALQFPDKDRTMFYLFLSTHDPTGALKLNEILYKAKLLEFDLRNRNLTLKNIPKGQLSLWNPLDNISKPEKVIRPSYEDISKEIHECFIGRTLAKREIYREMVDSQYFPIEIDNSLKLLQKHGKIKFNGQKINHRTKITFNG